jgi:hypothetical protein
LKQLLGLDRGEAEVAKPATGIPEEAEDIVDQLKDQFPGADVQVQTVDLSQNPEARAQVIGMAEAATGQDLDGDGVVQKPGSAAATSGADDRIAQLERIAKLREQGVLSQAEMEAEKARILGSGS